MIAGHRCRPRRVYDSINGAVDTVRRERVEWSDLDGTEVEVEESRSPAQQTFPLDPDELARKCAADECLVTVDRDLPIPGDAPHFPFARVTRNKGHQRAALRVAIDLRGRFAAQRIVRAYLVELDHPAIADPLLGFSVSRRITFQLA